MSISNSERMVEALVRDEMNYIRTFSYDDLLDYVECLTRDRFQRLNENQIIEEYESLA
jgi:hypothetical protein